MLWSVNPASLTLAANMIKRFEGFRPLPYLCPAGRWTIGYGTTRYPDGRAVAKGDPQVFPPQAFDYLLHELADDEHRLHPLLVREPSPNQYAALLSLAYNIGVGRHDGIKGDLADSTLLDHFNAGRIEAAADQFLVWNKAHVNGKLETLSGLKVRREAERKLFLGMS